MPTFEQRKVLHENLKFLVKSEYEQIFRILKKYNQEYTENSNGIFFDINKISDDAFIEMHKFMEFCLENRRQEQNRITELAELSTEVNTLLSNNK
jgi:hypothetical protein